MENYAVKPQQCGWTQIRLVCEFAVECGQAALGSEGQGVGCVGDGGSGSQGGGDHGGFSYLGVGCAGFARVAGVDINAIRALRREGNGDGDQLLH